MIFLLFCATWSCSSQEITNLTANDDIPTEFTESFTTQSIELETDPPSIVEEIELTQILVQEPETHNEIDEEPRPTKKPKRPNTNKRPGNMGKRPQHHHYEQSGPPPLTAPWPYFPAPPQMPYPMAYPSFPPMYYPMPMYSPYFFPPQMCNQRKPSENVSPPKIEQMDPTDSSDSEMESIPKDFLKFVNLWDHEMKFGNKTSRNKNGTDESKPPKLFHIFWDHKMKFGNKTAGNNNSTADFKPPKPIHILWDHEMKFGNKTSGNQNSTTDSKPPKRFPVKNWIKNKIDEKNNNSNKNS